MSPETEYIIAVDTEDRQIGTVEKQDGHRRGVLHRAFSILVWDEAGRMLLQKRHPQKYHSGGLWTNACCGHPRPGEDTSAAAHRRLKEEMGFNCELALLGKLQYRADFANGLTEHEIVHVFRGRYQGIVVPNSEEVEAISWRPPEDVRREILLAGERFSVWFRRYVAEEWPIADETSNGPPTNQLHG